MSNELILIDCFLVYIHGRYTMISSGAVSYLTMARELMIEEARSSEEWASILELASKWEFQSLRKRAISELDSLATPIEKVILGRKYNIPELCLPAYVDLCQSNVPLTEEDGERLGLRDVIKIYCIRQELWGQEVRPSISSEDLLEKIKTHFPSVPPPPASPSHSEREPNPLPPQTPIRSPSPPTPQWLPVPRLPARTDSPQRPKTEDCPISPPNRVSEEADALNRIVSPATSVEIPPATPPQMPQPARPVIFNFTAAQKPDWTAEPLPIITTATGPAAKGKYHNHLCERIGSQAGQNAGPKPKAKPQKVSPNPPGTGKKGKKKAALLAAMNGNPFGAQPSPAQGISTSWA